jgi:hypothetical protein
VIPQNNNDTIPSISLAQQKMYTAHPKSVTEKVTSVRHQRNQTSLNLRE